MIMNLYGENSAVTCILGRKRNEDIDDRGFDSTQQQSILHEFFLLPSNNTLRMVSQSSSEYIAFETPGSSAAGEPQSNTFLSSSLKSATDDAGRSAAGETQINILLTSSSKTDTDDASRSAAGDLECTLSSGSLKTATDDAGSSAAGETRTKPLSSYLQTNTLTHETRWYEGTDDLYAFSGDEYTAEDAARDAEIWAAQKESSFSNDANLHLSHPSDDDIDASIIESLRILAVEEATKSEVEGDKLGDAHEEKSKLSSTRIDNQEYASYPRAYGGADIYTSSDDEYPPIVSDYEYTAEDAARDAEISAEIDREHEEFMLYRSEAPTRSSEIEGDTIRSVEEENRKRFEFWSDGPLPYPWKSNLVEQAPKSQPPQGSLFQRLPTEIQIAIWEVTMPAQLIQIPTPWQVKHWATLGDRREFPAFQVCRLSRWVAEQKYRIFHTKVRPYLPYKYTIDFEKDVVYINPHYSLAGPWETLEWAMLLIHADVIHFPDWFSRIKILALNMEGTIDAIAPEGDTNRIPDIRSWYDGYFETFWHRLVEFTPEIQELILILDADVEAIGQDLSVEFEMDDLVEEWKIEFPDNEIFAFVKQSLKEVQERSGLLPKLRLKFMRRKGWEAGQRDRRIKSGDPAAVEELRDESRELGERLYINQLALAHEAYERRFPSPEDIERMEFEEELMKACLASDRPYLHIIPDPRPISEREPESVPPRPWKFDDIGHLSTWHLELWEQRRELGYTTITEEEISALRSAITIHYRGLAQVGELSPMTGYSFLG
jgi:hypothetical protein